MHGTSGLKNPWHHLRKMSSWVGNPSRPPYVIPRWSAGCKKGVVGESVIDSECMHVFVINPVPAPISSFVLLAIIFYYVN